jgi:hypothetical protein
VPEHETNMKEVASAKNRILVVIMGYGIKKFNEALLQR